MDAAAFFSLVLPDTGFRCVAVPNEHGAFKHHFITTNSDAGKLAAELDRRGKSVYFGIASFATRESRKGENTLALKTFIADIDCGAGKSYEKKSDAARAVSGFSNIVGIAAPYIVSSGNGLHAYWPLDLPLDPDVWRETSALLKAVMAHAGLAADPSRTADAASVLRVPGTHNRKREPKLVKIVADGAVTTHQEFRAALDRYAATHNVVSHVTRPTARLSANDALSAGVGYSPANAELIAAQCPVLGHMRDTGGNVDQPTWYYGLCVLACCENGEQLAHDWSDGHPDYTPEETAAKFAQAQKAKPATCARFAEHNPAACQGCPHFGKVKSPIALGYLATAAPAAVAALPPTPSILGVPPTNLGGKFTNINNKLTVEVLDENGSPVKKTVCNTLFWPVSRIHANDVYEMELEMIVRPGEHRRFVIPTAVIGKGGTELAGLLAEKEIVARPKMEHHIQHYLKNMLDIQRQLAAEMATYTHFGWHNETDFLVGNTLITPKGNRRVLLAANAAQKGALMQTKGSYDAWKRVIARMYNNPEDEPLQFLIMTSFAAPLFALFQEFGGVTVYAASAASGVGKTTAQRAGLSAWGNWEGMQLSEGKVTGNALWAIIGMYCNLPVVYDEMTNIKDEAVIGDMVFSISSGRQKERLDQTGALRENNNNWKTIVSASGNNLLSEKLSVHRANAEAELSRMFEFRIKPKEKPAISPNEAATLLPQLLENYGHAGQEFMAYVVKNLPAVRVALEQRRLAFNNHAGIKPNERYWSVLAASVLVATEICNSLGIVPFNSAALLRWISSTVKRNRVQKVAQVATTQDMFGRLLADIWSGILVTQGEGDIRKNVDAYTLQHPRGQLTGRVILPTSPNELHVLYLNAQTVKEWCSKKGVSAEDIFESGVNDGWLAPKQTNVRLGKGSFQYSSTSAPVSSWVVDLPKLMTQYEIPIAQKLSSIQGGLPNVGQAGSQ